MNLHFLESENGDDISQARMSAHRVQLDHSAAVLVRRTIRMDTLHIPPTHIGMETSKIMSILTDFELLLCKK